MFLNLILLVCYFNIVVGIRCIESHNATLTNNDAVCEPSDTLCANVIMKLDEFGEIRSFSGQGCASEVTWHINYKSYRCTTKGIINLNDYDSRYSGSVNCCDTDLCNSATSTYYVFGISVLFVVTPLFFY